MSGWIPKPRKGSSHKTTALVARVSFSSFFNFYFFILFFGIFLKTIVTHQKVCFTEKFENRNKSLAVEDHLLIADLVEYNKRLC